ncbi:MAG: hypothetical protein KGM43_14740 [Planctomycetota bacterium]|nr:hypothetical protein [Planctomycetota bacterium]
MLTNDPKLADAAQAKLRRQALDWLHAEPATWTKIFASGPTEERADIVQTLRHWQEDADLAGIRDEKALTKLPQAERAALNRLWTDVATIQWKEAATMANSNQSAPTPEEKK